MGNHKTTYKLYNIQNIEKIHVANLGPDGSTFELIPDTKILFPGDTTDVPKHGFAKITVAN
jgi:hypothetical protein